MRRASLVNVVIRPAKPEDAESMATLYKEIYTIENSGERSERYPFPQFLNPLWFASNLTRKEYCWIVAEIKGEIIGCFGALRNIGNPESEDRIAEQTGLVVHDRWRRHGVATLLMEELCKRIKNNSHFIIAETRTANPGGWKAARKYGFIPIGYEPFAHMTDSGHEPMLMLGKLSENVLYERKINYTTSPIVKKLAQQVCRLFRINSPDAKETTLNPITFNSGQEIKKVLVPVHPAFTKISFENEDEKFLIVSGFFDDNGFSETELIQMSNHIGGIVELKRLEGEDTNSNRYIEKYFFVYYGKELLSSARVLSDRLDQRARILSFKTKFHGLQGILISEILKSLTRDTHNKDLKTIVLDVRADFPDLHLSLEQLGFFPTAYYPSLISNGRERIDAVQFTLILDSNINSSLQPIEHLDAECNNIANTVLSFKLDSMQVEG